MKPADFFLSLRQFFGYFLPGSVLLTSLFLIAGYHPGSLSGWFSIAAFIFCSYVLGLTFQGLMYKVVLWQFGRYKHKNTRRKLSDTKTERWTLLRDSVRTLLIRKAENAQLEDEIRKYIEGLDDEALGEVCKRYVLENASYIYDEILDHEGTINFLVGMTVSLPLLAISSLIYCYNYYQSGVKVSLYALIVVLIIVLRWRPFLLPFKRDREIQIWMQNLLIIELSSGEKLMNDGLLDKPAPTGIPGDEKSN